MTTELREVRAFEALEFRLDGQEGRTLKGHAAVFNKLSVPIAGLFQERIAPGAFTKAILNDDVRALWQHDRSEVLGRTKSGTLRLSEDKRGLAFENDLPETQRANDLIELIQRGDVDEVSFGFRATDEEWEEPKEGSKKLAVRTLKEVKLFDISPVAFAAYPHTDVAVRAFEDWQGDAEALVRGRAAQREREIRLMELGVPSTQLRRSASSTIGTLELPEGIGTD